MTDKTLINLAKSLSQQQPLKLLVKEINRISLMTQGQDGPQSGSSSLNFKSSFRNPVEDFGLQIEDCGKKRRESTFL